MKNKTKEQASKAYHKAVMLLTGHGENNLSWMQVIKEALQDEPQAVDLVLKHFPNVKPSDDYKLLRKQFMSLLNLLSANKEICSFYMKQDYSLSEKRLKKLEDSLESEKAMNALLTDEIESLRPKT